LKTNHHYAIQVPTVPKPQKAFYFFNLLYWDEVSGAGVFIFCKHNPSQKSSSLCDTDLEAWIADL